MAEGNTFPLTTHELDGNLLCRHCEHVFRREPKSMTCPGVKQYEWDEWPKGMRTATQLRKERLMPGPIRGAIYYPGAADGSGYLWLYRRDEATDKPPLSEIRQNAIKRAKATRRANRTCQLCERYVKSNNLEDYLTKQRHCRQCSEIMWARELLSSEFVILDTETTGLYDAEVIQIAVIDQTGTVLLNSYIKPVEPIDESDDAFGVNGISNAMVADAPGFQEIYPRLRELLTDRVVVAYNASFDSRLLREACDQHEMEPLCPTKWKCAMTHFATYYGDYSRKYGDYKFQSLGWACFHMDCADMPDHSGAADCLATLGLIRALAATQPKKGTEDVESLEGKAVVGGSGETQSADGCG